MKFFLVGWFVCCCYFSLMAQSPAQSDALGQEAAEQGNWALAYSYYSDAFQKDSLSFERKFNLAYCAMKVYEDARAIRLLREVNQTDQGKLHPEALYYLGKLYQRRGDYPMAEQCWKKLKKKISKVAPTIVTSSMLDNELAHLVWAMQQPENPEIQLDWYPWNSAQSDAHPHWQGDTILFQRWNGEHWQSMEKVPNGDTARAERERWQDHPVLQISKLDQWRIGVIVLENGTSFLVQKVQGDWQVIPPLHAEGVRSSMPCLVQLDGIPTLFFASDRLGGSGGWDIWMSRWQSGWQSPVVLDERVNTIHDEVAPFYTDQSLYFSSKGHRGFGEMDIFKTIGKPGNWGVVENLGRPINSSKNDIGIAVRKEKKKQEWLLASARRNEGCCLDIGHWTLTETEKDTTHQDSVLQVFSTLKNWLPLSLYFHNDEPNPKSNSAFTESDYAQCWQSYTEKSAEYLANGVSAADWEMFEDEQLNIPYQKLQRILEWMLIALKNGDTLHLQLRGFASPLAAQEYNEKLTSRRVQAVKNEMLKFKNGALRPYLDQQLFIEEWPLGESQIPKGVSDDVKNKRESVFSYSARMARKIEIIGIQLKQ